MGDADCGDDRPDQTGAPQLTKRSDGEAATRREDTSPVSSLEQIAAEAEASRGKAMHLGEAIQYRHKLTANIKFNLYGGGTKEEGRRALAARNSLDEIIFGLTASDMVNDDLGGLEGRQP